MYAVPTPKLTNNIAVKPKLTEEDFMENGEKIAEAMEFGNEAEITVFFQKRFETVAGKIKSADMQTGILRLRVNQDSVRININNIAKANIMRDAFSIDCTGISFKQCLILQVARNTGQKTHL